MKWLGVTRAKRFSPGMADKDLSIMKAVADLLEAEGSQMELCTEENFETETGLDRWREVDGVFTMRRGEKALEQLQRLELKGIPVLNPTAGIRNAERKNITRLMIEHGIPMPQTWRVDETQMPDCSFPCWLKRADGWAQKRKDVAFAESREQLLAAAIEMRRGNIQTPATPSSDWRNSTGHHSVFCSTKHRSNVHVTHLRMSLIFWSMEVTALLMLKAVSGSLISTTGRVSRRAGRRRLAL